MQFVKLNKRLDFDYTDSGYCSSYSVNGKGIFYHTVTGYESDVVMSMIPEEYRADFLVRLMKINASITPHTDNYVMCGINIYIDPGHCETRFYTKADTIEGERITTQTTGRRFKEEELEFASSFVAEKGDVYLLDISQPHSVKNLSGSPVERTVVVIQTNKHDFNAVIEMLKQTEWI